MIDPRLRPKERKNPHEFRQGHEGAKKFMTVLESKLMTPEQIAEGQKRAREFKPRKVRSRSSSIGLFLHKFAIDRGFATDADNRGDVIVTK